MTSGTGEPAGEPLRLWTLADVATRYGGGIKTDSLHDAINRAIVAGDPPPAVYAVTETTGVRLWNPNSGPAWEKWAGRRLRAGMLAAARTPRPNRSSDKR